jgi:hypothetical protein
LPFAAALLERKNFLDSNPVKYFESGLILLRRPSAIDKPAKTELLTSTAGRGSPFVEALKTKHSAQLKRIEARKT